MTPQNIDSDLSRLVLPNQSLYADLYESHFQKDGGATITAALAAIGTVMGLLKQLRQLSHGSDDIFSTIKNISKSIQKIREAVLRIEELLEQLPLLIDMTMKKNFIDFIRYRLNALIMMYLEAKSGMIDNQPLPPEIREQLQKIYHDLRFESRQFMGYGTPAVALIALTYSIEDDCAKILGIGTSYRKPALDSIKEFNDRILTGDSNPATADSIQGYLAELTETVPKFDAYLLWLDENFPGMSRPWATDWVVIRRWGSILRGGGEESERWRHRANVTGSSAEGFTYHESRTPERRTDTWIGEEPGGPERDRLEMSLGVNQDQPNAVESNYNLADDLFNFQVSATSEDVAYANLVQKKRQELKAAMASLVTVKQTIDDANRDIATMLEIMDQS